MKMIIIFSVLIVLGLVGLFFAIKRFTATGKSLTTILVAFF